VMEVALIDLEPYMRAVTSILMHSLWQGILAGILAAIALSLLRKSSARIRYAVSCSAMAAVIVAVAMTAVAVWPERLGPARHLSATADEQAGGAGGSDRGAIMSAATPTTDASSSIRRWQDPSFSRYVVVIWAAGVVLFSVYHLIGWRRARGFARRGNSPVFGEAQPHP